MKKAPHPAVLILARALALGANIDRMTFRGLSPDAARQLIAAAELEGAECDCGNSGDKKIVSVRLWR